MGKRTPLLEWHIEEKQDDQRHASSSPTLETTPSLIVAQRNLYQRYTWKGLLVLPLLLAITGVWLWHTAQAGLDQIEGELRDAVQIEIASVAPVSSPLALIWAIDPAAMAWEFQLERERDTLHRVLPSEALETQLKTTNLRGEVAVADFITNAKDSSQAYRQSRFYRYTDAGWQRTQPDATLWGARRHLESSHFIFDFRQGDAEIVDAVAPQIDALYVEIRHNFGLAPEPEKRMIEVTVEQVTGVIPTPRWEREPLVVPSPAVYLAPVELSDDAILAQSIALPLIDYMGQRAIKDNAIPYRWQSLLFGLQLWQLWELDIPLAHWRQDVVRWLYIDAPIAIEQQRSMLPASYTELCAMHRLWMLSPMVAGIPLECTAWDGLTWSSNQRAMYVPRRRLDQLSMAQVDWENPHSRDATDPYHAGEAVVVATLIEYAVATYGNEQLPDLLAALAQYDDWDTLLLAVYGVSASEFEAGWREYLAQEYGAQPYLLRH